jgi:hypothetical protein
MLLLNKQRKKDLSASVAEMLGNIGFPAALPCIVSR